MVLDLFTLSNNVLHLYQVLPKNLKPFQLQTRILESMPGWLQTLTTDDCCIVLLFYVHVKHLSSCQDGQLI